MTMGPKQVSAGSPRLRLDSLASLPWPRDWAGEQASRVSVSRLSVYWDVDSSLSAIVLCSHPNPLSEEFILCC